MDYKLELVEFIKGDNLCTQGDAAEEFYILSEGEVEVYAYNKEGDKVHFADLGKGQVIGELAIFTGGRRSANVVAKTDVKAFKINKEGYNELVDGLPNWVVSLIESLVERLKHADEKILANSMLEKKIKTLLEEKRA